MEPDAEQPPISSFLARLKTDTARELIQQLYGYETAATGETQIQITVPKSESN